MKQQASERFTGQLRLLGVTILIGLAAGLAAVAFRNAADALTGGLIESRTHLGIWEFALWVAPTMILGALFSGWLMARFAPDAAGSGIPQVKLGYHEGRNDFSLHVIWVKFVGGVVAIGTGSSLGREGPTIHIGAALASWFSRWTGESKEAKANAVCAGSAAGLAAAFNSPLAGVTLVMEEIAGGKDAQKFGGRSLLAAALAVLVIHLMIGDMAALPLDSDMIPTVRSLYLAVLVSLVAGGLGLFFQWGTLSLRGFSKRLPVPPAIKPALGASVACVVAVLAFALTGNTGVFGLGETQLVGGLNNQIIWQAAALLAVAKLIATIFCYGSGGCGGIFAPILFFGAMSGSAIVGGLQVVFDLTDAERTLLSVTAISACLAAVVRAPLTSILIVLEMTRLIYAVPLLMIAAVIGVYMNRFAFRDSFYSAALAQDGTPVRE
jgi:CIC family chloride channel protein